ncbi:MAG: sensor histidine kinase [Steroidobacteraceae bacterium]
MDARLAPALSIRRRLLILLLPALVGLMLAGAFANYRAADLISRSMSDPVHALSPHLVLAGTWLLDFIQVDVTLLVVWIGVHFGLKPLLSLREQIESRSVRELQPLDIAEVPAEVRPLVDTLNLLFTALGETARSQRQFVADAAHQLRTPITGLLGHLELLSRDPAAEPVRERLESLHAGMSRLAHSANQLLALARADPSARAGERLERLDFPDLVARGIELHMNRAIDAGYDLGAEAQAAAVLGNGRLLDDLLGNLIDNALSYTPPGSRITVRCGSREDRAFIEVEDDGPGIPAAERLHVRQRFYRIPGSQGLGCGLGLAIVDEIARVHDAELSIESGANGRGTRVIVEFARARAAAAPRTAAAAMPETAKDVAL